MIIIWVVFGLIAGLLAKWLLFPQSREGTAGTMLLEMTTALMGGVIASRKPQITLELRNIA